MSSTGMSAGVKAIKAFRIRQLRNVKNTGRVPPTKDFAVPHQLPNPFIPYRNPSTGHWRAAKVSLRRQADLVKLAKATNMLHLLPPGPKAPKPLILSLKEAASDAQTRLGVPGIEAPDTTNKILDQCWTNPVEWVGEPKVKEVAGADIGTRLYAMRKRMFKGHRWERLKKGRDIKRKILMRDMARRVKNYKSYYRRRRPDPLKPSASSKGRKLPF